MQNNLTHFYSPPKVTNKFGETGYIYNTSVMERDDSGRVYWAGQRHERVFFRKKKDDMADWTNVLFRP